MKLSVVLPLPPFSTERGSSFMTAQSRYPATPSPSATLILARKHEAEIEVYLFAARRQQIYAGHLCLSRRQPGSPKTWMRPSGKTTSIPVDQLAQALDGEVGRMLPFAVAAIRETWEEAGLLLTTPMETIASPERVGSSYTPFPRRIQARGLRLAVAKLGRWHHWITPELMPRRFDTFFFVAPVKENKLSGRTIMKRFTTPGSIPERRWRKTHAAPCLKPPPW